MRRILLVSNGHGETAIAARIGRAVRQVAPDAIVCDLFPLVGTGGGAGELPLVGPRRAMPSGGLVAMGNVRAFAGDLRAGFLGLLAAQLAFLRAARDVYDVIVAVGDAYGLALALSTGTRTVFVGTAKSVYVAPYGAFERTLLRRAARAFVRDEPTAAVLRSQGVAAQAPGNVIVDLVSTGVPARPGRWIGLLPGSREAAYGDAVRLARVIRELGTRQAGPRALLSVAPTLESARFARDLAADGWAVRSDAPGTGSFVARAQGSEIEAWPGDLGALLAASVAVVGQAGTANEQAAALGIPVIALDDAGARSGAWYRMRQRRLLGDAFALVSAEPRAGANALADLLGDPERMAAMGRAGRARMGRAGGADAIAAAILSCAA